MKRYDSVDAYIEGAEQWQAELIQLRTVLNATPLEETVKWGAPCYTFDGKNLVGIGAFKSYVGLWFFQGALLADPENVLRNAQDGKTKALRQWRFESKKEIRVRLIKSYVQEAIELQQQGKKIKPAKNKTLTIPVELSQALGAHPKAKEAFQTLSKGKQREYADHIAEAKRDETKLKRIEKIIPMIVDGKGLHDKYRNC